jgi:hypothetical protein
LDLLRNKFLIKTYYPIVFPKYNGSELKTIIREKKNPFIEVLDTTSFDDQMKKDFSLWVDVNWTQNQYISVLNTTHWYDPINGWAVANNRLLVYDSLGFSHVPYLRRPALKLLLNKNRLNYKRIISLRDTGEQNYFHFFNDVIAKFYFLKQHQMIHSDDIILVSESLFYKSYFQYFLKHTSLKNFKIISQRNEDIIQADQSVFCKPYTHSLSLLNAILSDLKIPSDNLSSNKRIFLSRSKKSLRYLSNEDEVIECLKNYNYEVVDTNTMTFEEQIDLFSKTSHLISVHGAGLTNMLFRNGGPMHVVEIFSPYLGYNPFHYILLANQLKYNYHYINGIENNDKINGGFLLNIQALESLLKKIHDS